MRMAASVTAVAALLCGGFSAFGADLKVPLEPSTAAVVKAAPAVRCSSKFEGGVPCLALLEVPAHRQVLVRIVTKLGEQVSVRVSVYPSGSIEPRGLVCGPTNTLEGLCVIRFKFSDGAETAMFLDVGDGNKMQLAHSRQGGW